MNDFKLILYDYGKRPNISILGLFFAFKYIENLEETVMSDIILRQLTEDFYSENIHLEELLDKMKDGTFVDKGRGYGVLMVDVLGHKFAIPLRSGMQHKNNFATVISKDASKITRRKGLDYTKAVIITEERFVTDHPFKIPQNQFLKISKSEHLIILDFTKSISRYIKAIQKQDKNILWEYRFSTFKNYHAEFGLVEKVEDSVE